jgi:integrase
LFSYPWTNAKDRAGVDCRLRFHDLRHRYASVLIEAGLDALTMKTLMGHSSITETYDTYRHLFPTQSERVAKAVAAARLRSDHGRPQAITDQATDQGG